jgi:hypothetical protein
MTDEESSEIAVMWTVCPLVSAVILYFYNDGRTPNWWTFFLLWFFLATAYKWIRKMARGEVD